MKNIAFIPVRGGSKSIPYKNIKEIAGKPLVYWVTKAAEESKYIDEIYVSTDDKLIAETVKKFNFSKVNLVIRSSKTSTDEATTESAMLEFSETYDFDNIALIQATSPLLTANDIDKGFFILEKNNADSVLSVVKQKRFHWSLGNDGMAIPINYDFMNRPRRQDFEGYYVENGAFYITKKQFLLDSKCRISGKVKLVEMDENSYFEIDEPSDWKIVENLIKDNLKDLSIFNTNIKLLLTDCDGTLTDGGMYYNNYNDELKKFNTRDAVGLRLLKENNIKVGIITSENSNIVKRRSDKMNLDFVYLNVTNKKDILYKICEENDIKLSEVAYVGDDLNDIEILKLVGFSCCVQDACENVKKICNYICKNKGGDGAVREVADLILSNKID